MSDPMTTFRERVEALKLPHDDSCDMVLVEMSRHCTCGANLYNEAIDAVLALLDSEPASPGGVSETERASRELEVILDKRAAQLIREYGLSADEARRKAEKDYRAEMNAATAL